MTSFQTNERYFRDDYEVTFVFDDNINTFGKLESVFRSFLLLDMTYNNLIIDRDRRPNYAHSQRTMVTRVSKESPLEIAAFIENHWLTLFLLYLASYKDIKTNISESFQDIDCIVDIVEKKLRELTADFPDFEIDLIKLDLIKIIQRIKLLAEEDKNRIERQIRRIEFLFRHMIQLKINKKKTPHNTSL